LSEQVSTSQPLTPEQQYQQMFNRLSVQFKDPLRNIMGQAEEVAQNTISNLIQQLIQINNAVKNSNQEVLRLQKLCTDNKINFKPLPPNRAERREQERKAAKNGKITHPDKK